MACIAARGTICCCVCSRDVFHPCSFGSAGILALASTSKLYAAGLKHEVRHAMGPWRSWSGDRTTRYGEGHATNKM